MNSFEQDRSELSQRISEAVPCKWAAGLIAEATVDSRGFEGSGLIDCLAEGRGGWGSNPGGIDLPDELVEKYGGEEAQYGYVEFEIDAGPGGDPYWIDQVPFADAFRMFEIAASYYVEKHPSRREEVALKMGEARKTFGSLIARHESWKKANKMS